MRFKTNYNKEFSSKDIAPMDPRVAQILSNFYLKRAMMGLAYLIFSIVLVFVASGITRHADQRSLKKVVAQNATTTCSSERSRWILDKEVIDTENTPIALPPNTPANAYNYSRVVARNKQLVIEKTHLLNLLGSEPKLC